MTLFDLPIDPTTLRPRQLAVYQLLQRSREGITAAEAGAAAHAVDGCRFCDLGNCSFVQQDGRAILHALRHRGLAAERRKLGVWVAPTTRTSAQLTELPEWL